MYYIGHMGYFGGFGMIFFWGAFIWLVIWLINKNKESCSQNTVKPMEIAKERYAKGEITKKQFQDMSDEIRN